MNEPRNDWDDRLVDAALHELHGSKPPDLSARVVLALQAGAVGPLPTLRPQPRHHLLPWLALAAAAVLLVGALVTVWLYQPTTWSSFAPSDARLDVQVFGGVLETVEFGATAASVNPATVEPATVEPATVEPATVEPATMGPPVGERPAALPPAAERPGAGTAVFARHGPDARASFSARPGNRLRAELQCLAQIGPFGVLAAGPSTDLEVRSMEFTWKHGVVAASTLTLAVVAGTVTWHTLTRTETAVAGETLRLQAEPDGARGAGALAAENERLRQRVAELEQQSEAAQLSRSKPPVPTPLEATEPLEPPPPESVAVAPNAAPFSDPRFAEALAKVDWRKMGTVTHEMGPLLAKLVAAMAEEGAEMPIELAMQVGQLNMKLVEQVPAMMEAGLPGFGPNGTYTHPLVVANTLATTLEAAGASLNDGQKTAIEGLVRSFSAENQAVADSSREFELEHLLAETEMKDRFYREVGTLLAPEQYGKVFLDGAQDYEGSGLFSTGLMTKPYAKPIPAKDAAEFARTASNRLGEQLGLDDAAVAKVRAVLERSAAAPELWQHPTIPAESALQMLRSGRTMAALRRQLDWMREIQQHVPLTQEQRKKLASMKHVLVPLPR